MHQKEETYIVTFPTTAAALAMERRAKELGLPGRLIPTPVSITASCGLAWMCGAAEESHIRTALVENELAYGAVQVILL